MELRRHFFGVVALVAAAAPLPAESQLRTQNFLVHAPTPQLAEQFKPAMMRVWVDNGCVTRIDEYLDSGQISVLT